MDAPPSAPPVVAVVVTCEPGWWLEGCLEALANQDYPNLAVLVIDAASPDDPTARVAGVMPSAYVRRVSERAGFAAAANEVLGVVEGASHFLFCHDDVAPEPDSVRLLVEEAYRSNAGIVTPKLVEWAAVDRLLAVGAGADKGGIVVPLVERGEIDQEQHDAVRDVFVAPAGCMLVRADLFTTLGGFDPVMAPAGEDLDLSWRGQIAGARVVVAPGAVVRHLEATATGRRALDGTLLAGDEAGGGGGQPAAVSDAALRDAALRRRRNGRRPSRSVSPVTAAAPVMAALEQRRDEARLRAVLKNYGLVHLLRVLPQLAAVTVVEVVLAVASGRIRRVGSILAPWRAALAPGRKLRAARREVQRLRAIPDHEVRHLQARGNARLRAVLRRAVDRTEDPLRPASIDLSASWRAGRLTLGVWSVVVAVLLFGTRHLLGSHLPTYGEFVPIPSVGTLVRHALSGWRATGMGSASPAPTALWLLAGTATLLWGHVGFLQRVLVLGLVPVGAVGAARLGRPFGSRRARLVTTVLYVVNPLPYDALSRGHWSGLVAYGVIPWVMLLLVRATGLAPFRTPVGGPAVRQTPGIVAPGIAVGVVLAVAGAFVPFLVPLAVAIAAVIAVGSIVAGGVEASLRAVAVALVGALTAALLLFPWAIGFLPPYGQWASFTRVAPATDPAVSLAHLLRFQTGPTGGSPLAWAVLAVAALPLVVGADWRFAWAVRLWAVAAGAWALAWVGTRGWLPFPLPPTEVVLAAGAAALATCAGLGLAAFEIDLRGYRFGWRQVVATVAAAAAVLAVLPVLGAAFDGRWHSPSGGVENVLSWMADKRTDGDFRVLWLGDPAVVPIAGWQLGRGLEYATSRDGMPDLTTSWPGSSHGATQLLAQAVQLAQRGQTTQLGHLLAPMAVRYLVIVTRSAPTGQPGTARPAPPSLVDGLGSQVDLRPIDSDPTLLVYENAAWVPLRAQLPAGAGTAGQTDDPASARTTDLSGAKPVLVGGRGPTSFRGPVDSGQVLVAEAPSSSWHLRVAGADAPRTSVFGSANEFAVAAGGPATLRYRTPVVRYLALVLQMLLWLGALGWLWRRRRRGSSNGSGQERAEARGRPVPAAVPRAVPDPMFPVSGGPPVGGGSPAGGGSPVGGGSPAGPLSSAAFWREDRP